MVRRILATTLIVIPVLGFAATPADIQAAYETEARQSTPGFAGASAPRGEQLFRTNHRGEWSCGTCHGAPPTGEGKHAKTGKPIGPLAPSANAQRLTDSDKVEKWLRRNCKDVLGRECSTPEKSDVIAYLRSVGK